MNSQGIPTAQTKKLYIYNYIYKHILMHLEWAVRNACQSCAGCLFVFSFLLEFAAMQMHRNNQSLLRSRNFEVWQLKLKYLFAHKRTNEGSNANNSKYFYPHAALIHIQYIYWHHTLAMQAMADCSAHTKSNKIF